MAGKRSVRTVMTATDGRPPPGGGPEDAEVACAHDVHLRFDVLTKTKQPELCRYWTQRDRAANVRLFHLAAEILHAIDLGVFVPNPGWQCKDCPYRSRCWAGSDGPRA